MAKNKSNPAIAILIIGFIMFLVGAVLVAVPLVLNSDAQQDSLAGDIMLYGGGALAALGLVMAIITICVANKGNSKKSKSNKQATTQNVNAEEVLTYDNVEYFATPAEYEFVNVGKHQSTEDKFDQIGKMGKTQFVIYMARLFSLRGYEVQLTPVIDNHGVDMLVKKDGATRAVSCVLANKVLCAEDIKYANEGKSFYQISGAIIITNMYFDRTSLEYARSHNWTLVDRNILAEQYMR